MKDIIIRNATFDDITEVAKLHVDSWYETYVEIISQDYLDSMKNNIEKRTKRMKNEFNMRTMVVAILNDEIIGFSEFVFSNEFSKELDIDCELCGLYIKNGFKNLGIGSIMFEYVTNLFVEKGKKKMGLWCLKENVPVISFYKKKGGIITTEKNLAINDKEYCEIALLFDLR